MSMKKRTTHLQMHPLAVVIPLIILVITIIMAVYSPRFNKVEAAPLDQHNTFQRSEFLWECMTHRHLSSCVIDYRIYKEKYEYKEP